MIHPEVNIYADFLYLIFYILAMCCKSSNRSQNQTNSKLFTKVLNLFYKNDLFYKWARKINETEKLRLLLSNGLKIEPNVIDDIKFSGFILLKCEIEAVYLNFFYSEV